MKITTGIKGLDKMLFGGFLEGRNILITGPAGCGKTTIGIQFVYHGVIKLKEAALFVTLEENKAKIYDDMKKFGFDLVKAEKTGRFLFIGGPVANLDSYMKKVDASVDHLIAELEEVIKEKKIKRVVIDPINALTMLPESEDEKRISLAKLCNMLSALDCASMLLSETKECNAELSRYGMEEFVADGVIALYHTREGSKLTPGIVIKKMRGTNHDKEIRMYSITDKGIIVYPDETMFGKI